MNVLSRVFFLTLLLLTSRDAFGVDSPALTDHEIVRLLTERVETKRTNASIVVSLIDANGARVFAQGRINDNTLVRPDQKTIYELGSVTKLFTSLLLADMVEKGEVRLNDHVSMYLPKNVTVPSRNGRQIRLIDLATHMSGLPRLPSDFGSGESAESWSNYSVERLYAFLSEYQLPREIGESEEYSNLGSGLLGHALALRAGMSFETLIRTRITEPLGMNDTSFTLNAEQSERFASGHLASGKSVPHFESSTLAAAGALRSTAGDMLIFMQAAMGALNTPLHAAFKLMEQPILTDPDIKLAWGYNDQFGSQILWHQGKTFGFSSYIGIDKANKRAVMVFSSTKKAVTDLGFRTLNREHDLQE